MERVDKYRSTAILTDIESRVMVTEFYVAHHVQFRDLGDDMLSLGAYRAGLGTVIGLAAEPARTRETAILKVEFLRDAGEWLSRNVVVSDGVDVVPMLAAAASVEGRHWSLPRRRRVQSGRPMTSRLGSRLNPAVRERYLDLAEPHDLHVALRRVARVDADLDVLQRQGDLAASAGALDVLVVAVLHAMATPSTVIDELELKRAVLEEFGSILRPAELLGPMVEAAVVEDGRRLGASPEQAAALHSVLPSDARESS